MTGSQIRPSITREQWKILFAAQAGYLLDSMDVLLYVFAINALKQEFGFSNRMAGLVSSVTLITSAFGGILCGALSDRLGRVRMLAYTIWVYSLASAGAATAQSFGALLFWRAMVGFGLGGEWSAGAVLVAESWPAAWRVRATAFMQSGWALGYMLAAGVTAVVLPRFGWRALFLAGLAPALLAMTIRRSIPEPAKWKPNRSASSFWRIFRPPLARKTWLASALSASVLFAYWGLFTWIPGFLSTPVSQGGAGLSLLGTSASVIPMQFGAFLGYLTFGFMADRLGRRPAFILYVLASAALVPVYGWAPRLPGFRPEWLLALGPLIGFFGTGYFGLFGAMLAELYPGDVRGSGQGFTYNFGRALSAAAPFAIGAIADRNGLGAALGWNSAFFVLAALLIFTLPAKPVSELG